MSAVRYIDMWRGGNYENPELYKFIKLKIIELMNYLIQMENAEYASAKLFARLNFDTKNYNENNPYNLVIRKKILLQARGKFVAKIVFYIYSFLISTEHNIEELIDYIMYFVESAGHNWTQELYNETVNTYGSRVPEIIQMNPDHLHSTQYQVITYYNIIDMLST